MTYDVSNRSAEWLRGWLEGQRVTLREIEPLTLKTEDGRLVKVARVWVRQHGREEEVYVEAPDA